MLRRHEVGRAKEVILPAQQLSLLELTAAVFYQAAARQPTVSASEDAGSSRAAKRMRVLPPHTEPESC